MKILIADKLSQAGIDWLEQQDDVEVAVRPGLPPEKLAAAVRDFDGMIIRSGVKVREKVLAEPGRLKVIARAGVGVDNVDVPLATEKGVVVMNTPDANTVSTAELALTLMMALSRRVSPANASLREGQWNRKAFQGTQLAGKTLGIVGLGRIGQAVAHRALALDMRVLGFDPFVAGTAPEGVEMVRDLEALCRQADYLTVHVPKTPQTEGMIGAEQLAVMKPTARLINAARGGIIDEAALLEALQEERVAGAGLDVYTAEPPEDETLRALVTHPNVLSTPHLGASTEEAQEQVALQAAEQVAEFLRDGRLRNALNVPGFAKGLPPLVQAYGQVGRSLGLILAALAPQGLEAVEIAYKGRLAELNYDPVRAYVLVGLLGGHLDQPVNFVNAPMLAEQRGVEVEQITTDRAGDFAHGLEVRVATPGGHRQAAATVIGSGLPRVISIQDYEIEMDPRGHILLVFNDDQPGVVGKIGSILGGRGVNIADMVLSRKQAEAKALMGVRLDRAPPDDALAEIRGLDYVNDVRSFCLPEPEDVRLD